MVRVEMGVEGRLGTELNTLEPIGMDRPHAGMGVVQPVSAVWSALYERVLTPALKEEVTPHSHHRQTTLTAAIATQSMP